METLTFLAILAFCAFVLFWYISNVSADGQGEKGLLGIVRENIDKTLGKASGYREKNRALGKLEQQRETYAHRKERSLKKSSEVRDLHAQHKVVLKSVDGKILNSPTLEQCKEVKPVKFRKKSSKRFRTKERVIGKKDL